jgi:hypothetical protein
MLGVSKVDKVMKIVSRHIFYYFNVYMLFFSKISYNENIQTACVMKIYLL